MRTLFIMLFLIVLSSCSSPTDNTKSSTKQIHMKGQLSDLDRIDMLVGGRPVRVWIIDIYDLIQVNSVMVMAVQGHWIIPIYYVRKDIVLIPEQTNINLYSDYKVDVIIKQ